MTRGRVYLWTPDPSRPLGGSAAAAMVPLAHLEDAADRDPKLCGRYVRVHNGGAVHIPGSGTEDIRAVPIGDAQPDPGGDFSFEPGRGGGRMDKVRLAEPGFRWRYLEAAHFGEVNVYFHLDRMATYVDALLGVLRARPLPRVTAIVNAHHAATELDPSGLRDGLHRAPRWLPFQGAHYRLPGKPIEVAELGPISREGEIHFGPGRGLVEHGALVEAAGGRYRANASHNPGIIYHEYGHHVTRHTADFRANAGRAVDRQDNHKTALDEGMCDYWAAAMLETPHIWAFHQRHDGEHIHPRSLRSSRTMADYDHRGGADPHANGTIWASALWDLRSQLSAVEPDGATQSDLLVLGCLLGLGRRTGEPGAFTVKSARRARRDFATGLRALLEADELLSSGRRRAMILETFGRRGISLDGKSSNRQPHPARAVVGPTS
jgi:hypothetical protein